jgi:hypothetical protein
MDSAAGCPAYDRASAKILCDEKGTARTADLYSVKVPVEAMFDHDWGFDLRRC